VSSDPDIILVNIGSVSATYTLTLIPGSASSLIVNDTSGIVGSDVPIEARLIDSNGNGISGQTVNFSILSGGGYFITPLNIDSTDVTDNNGLAAVVYTLGTDVTASPAQIQVSFTGVPNQTVNVTLMNAPVGYYTFLPASDTTMTVGASRSYVLEARDQYGNPVANSGSVNLMPVTSSTAEFSRGNPVPFGTNDTLHFSVRFSDWSNQV